jgi:glycosyltransferase involved in cell wall biosynthesis
MIARPLRFCMITTFYPPYNFGGDGIFVHRLSNALARRGHQVDVIHCVDSYRLLARREPAKTYDDHPNVTVHGLKSPVGFLSPLATHQTGFPFFKSSRIRQILNKGFNVIHYHNISLVGGPKILEYGKGIKLYTMREYWLVCPTHVMFRFNRAACTHPHCLLCCLTYKRPPQWWRYLRLLEKSVRHVDAFISQTHFCKDLHHEMGLDVPTVCLPNFVPSAETGSKRSEQRVSGIPQGPYFLFVGRLEKLKGLQTLIPVFHQYRKAQLLIAGTGGYEAQLRRLAESSVNIHFLGFLSDEKLQALYRKAVALIVPSICFEIFGNVIIEAFRQQTPAIVRNMGGMPELIHESGGGLVYDTDKELVAAMKQLVADPAYRSELGLRGYQTCQRQWTPEAHLERYLALINEIAEGRGGRVG